MSISPPSGQEPVEDVDQNAGQTSEGREVSTETPEASKPESPPQVCERKGISYRPPTNRSLSYSPEVFAQYLR